jgi:hypothetical protein
VYFLSFARTHLLAKKKMQWFPNKIWLSFVCYLLLWQGTSLGVTGKDNMGTWMRIKTAVMETGSPRIRV